MNKNKHLEKAGGHLLFYLHFLYYKTNQHGGPDTIKLAKSKSLKQM
jgi:hypothetical protein